MWKENTMFKYAVIFERASDGGFGAYVPDLPGCVAVGDTIEQVHELITEGIELHLKGMREDGDAIPEPQTFAEMVEVTAA